MSKVIRAAFERHPIWLYHSLMHRLGESSSVRLEPRRFIALLKKALHSARGFIAEPLPRIYVHRASDRMVANDAANCVVQLERLREGLHPDPTNRILEAVVARASGSAQGKSFMFRSQQERRIGGEVFVQAVDRVWAGQLTARPCTVWISHDTNWIQLHDVRLWRFVEMCLAKESAGLIVARKIEPAVFPLLKGLGLRGLQYHALQAREGHGEEMHRIQSDLRWIRIQGIEDFARHEVLNRVEPILADTSQLVRESDRGSAVADALARGFAGNRAPRVSALLDWWTAAGIPVPRKTLEGLEPRRPAGSSHKP